MEIIRYDICDSTNLRAKDLQIKWVNDIYLDGKKICGILAETEYWIDMLVGSNSISDETAKEILQECGVVRRMLVKSVTTAKNG